MFKLFLNTLTIALVFSSAYFANPSFGFDLGGALKSLGEGIDKAGKEFEKGLQDAGENQNCREVFDDMGESETICTPKENQQSLEQPQQTQQPASEQTQQQVQQPAQQDEESLKKERELADRERKLQERERKFQEAERLQKERELADRERKLLRL